jgi:signal transduction histidine kinase
LHDRVLLQLSSVKQLKRVKVIAEIEDRIRLFNAFVGSDNVSEEPSFPFIHFSAHEDMPRRLAGYDLSGLSQTIKATYLIDLTLQDEEGVVTLAFVRKEDNILWLAIGRFPEIQEILMERTGLGETGESYIVGDDYRFRTASRFETEDDDVLVNSQGMQKALADQPGKGKFLDYRGVEVFSAYEKIEFPGITWVMLSEINADEALLPLREVENNLIFIVFIILLFILIVSFYLSRMLVSPLIGMEQKLIKLSKGVQDGVMTRVDRGDEIGRMYSALNKLVMALNETIKFAGQIGEGNFDARFEPLSKRDKLGEALLQMKGKLQAYQKNELKLMRQNQLSILNGEEKERIRLSKELHDGLGPMLTTLKLDIQSAGLEDNARSSLIDRIDHTIREVRLMSYNLRPSVLEDFGAGEAIGNLIEQIRGHAQVEMVYKNDMQPESEIRDEVHVALYRIAQEAINNALRHAEASRIAVSLSVFDDRVSLFISDNGKGFVTEEQARGNGLRNMHERAKLANGQMYIDSTTAGTTIEVEIPIP